MSGSESPPVVNGAVLLSFVGEIDGEMKEDVLNSTLLAQLTTNRQYDPHTQANDWLKLYGRTLLGLGWNVPEMEFLKSDDATASGSVDKFALAHSTQFISGSELIAFAYMIQSVAGEKNTEAARIFNNQALGEFGATFLLASVTETQGEAVLKISAYNYKSSEPISNALFHNFGSSTVEVFAGNGTMALNSAVYAQVRQQVNDKVRETTEGFIRTLVI